MGNGTKLACRCRHTSKFSKDFIENYYEDTDEGYFFEVDVEYPETFHDFHNDMPFYLNKWKLKKYKNL